MSEPPPTRPADAADGPTLSEQLETDDLFGRFIEHRHSAHTEAIGELLASAGDERDVMLDRVGLVRALDALGEVLVDENGESLAPDEGLSELGRFENLVLLGEGGLSRVYLGFDPRLGRDVALKVLKPRALDTAEARDWMLSEGRSLAKIEHRAVVRIYEVDEADGYPYVAMERVVGPVLHEVLAYLRDEDPKVREQADDLTRAAAAALATPAARLRLGLELAEALAACHAKGVVHRDFKPGNILLADGGLQAKLIDFGLAHLEGDGASIGLTQRLVGTAGYVAPEQVDNERTGADPQSDQFALGIVLYELLTLRHPFHRATRAETMAAVSEASPTPPRQLERSLSQDMERVVLHCLEREHARRYPSVQRVADDLRALTELRPISLRGSNLGNELRLWSRRNRRALTVAGTTALLLVSLLALRWGWLEWGASSAWHSRVEQLGSRIQTRADEASLPTVTPGEFGEFYDGLEELTAASSANQERLLAGALFERAARPLDDVRRALSSRLLSRVEPELKTIRHPPGGRDYEDQKALHMIRFWNSWRDVLEREQALDPANRRVAEILETGRARVEGAGQVLSWIHGATVPDMELVQEFDSLPAGRYRAARVEDGEIVGEVEFTVRIHAPARSIEVPRSSPEWASSMVELEGIRKELGKYAFVLPGFSITERPVRWGELQLGLEEEQIAYAFERARLSGPLDEYLLEAATIPQALAEEYARNLGLRLPSTAEYLVALEHDVLGDVAGMTDWTGTPADAFCTLVHAVDLEGPDAGADAIRITGGFPQCLRPQPVVARRSGSTFRLAKSRVLGAPGLRD